MKVNGYTLADKMRKDRRRFRFTAVEQALFYELVAICNGENWEDVFECSNNELCLVLSITEKTLIKARESLINSGILYYKSGKSKRTVCKYSFTKEFKTTGNITVDSTANGIANSIANSTANGIANPPDYIKQETKTKTKSIPNTSDVISISDFREMFQNHSWLEVVAMNYKIPLEKVSDFFNDFCNEQEIKEVELKPKNDFMSHFINCLKINKINLKEKSSAKKEKGNKSKLSHNIEAMNQVDNEIKKLLDGSAVS